jgi:hypothetical protein
MKSTTIYSLLAAAFATCTYAAGTPVLKARASSTLTPITITGNGTSSLQSTDFVADSPKLSTKEANDSTSVASTMHQVSPPTISPIIC